jgi:hypothetical protein
LAQADLLLRPRPAPPRPAVEVRLREDYATNLLAAARRAAIDWQFTNRQACVKLKRLYPVVKDRPD